MHGPSLSFEFKISNLFWSHALFFVAYSLSFACFSLWNPFFNIYLYIKVLAFLFWMHVFPLLNSCSNFILNAFFFWFFWGIDETRVLLHKWCIVQYVWKMERVMGSVQWFFLSLNKYHFYGFSSLKLRVFSLQTCCLSLLHACSSSFEYMLCLYFECIHFWIHALLFFN